MGTLEMNVKIETSELPPYFKYKEFTQYIKYLSKDGKGQWVELSDDELKYRMSGLMGYMYDKEIDNADCDAHNLKIYGADYYEETFSGFDQSVNQILEEPKNEENKVIDIRPPPLKITHEEETFKVELLLNLYIVLSAGSLSIFLFAYSKVFF